MAATTKQRNYPLSPLPSLQSQLIGKKLADLPTPSIILDRSKIKKNCDAMLAICAELGVGFRAHVKSHKTQELSRMQVGDTGPAHFIVSTLVEAEELVDEVRGYQESGRDASILYGVPAPQSALPRLIDLAGALKPGSISIILDNLAAFTQLHERLVEYKSSQPNSSPIQIGIFIKLDTGYHRAGLPPSSPAFATLGNTIAEETSTPGSGFFLKGFYSHYGHSYAGSSPSDAAEGLIAELVGLEEAIQATPSTFTNKEKLVLSLGATPTATAAQNMLDSSAPRVRDFHDILSRLKRNHAVEFHAGVYPLLDCQQVATHARPATEDGRETFAPLSKDAIAIRMLVEVSSVYESRGKPEALISAGSLALGREPCKSYPGWGIVTGELGNAGTQSVYEETGRRTGWIVGRISQEHGILSWEGETERCNALRVGDRLTVWPNHACVAGAGFGWYVVVDGDAGAGDQVVDVWARWRGW